MAGPRPSYVGAAIFWVALWAFVFWLMIGLYG